MRGWRTGPLLPLRVEHIDKSGAPGLHPPTALVATVSRVGAEKASAVQLLFSQRASRNTLRSGQRPFACLAYKSRLRTRQSYAPFESHEQRFLFDPCLSYTPRPAPANSACASAPWQRSSSRSMRNAINPSSGPSRSSRAKAKTASK